MYDLADFQALVVGVGNYANYEDLPETIRDAENLTHVLVDPARCGYPRSHVRLLTGEAASRGNILEGLNALAEQASYDATTLVYFSGHGGYISGYPQTIYLCPNEADPHDLAGTAISNEAFSAALATIQTPRLVVILDACHASGAASFKGAETPLQWVGEVGKGFALSQLRQGSGRIIFASSRREQRSWTYPSGRMSLFTYYLLEGLNGRAQSHGDGLIRVFDLFDYVSNMVRSKKRSQEPLLAAQDVSMNYPVALYLGGNKGGMQESDGGTQQPGGGNLGTTLRVQIVHDAAAGITAASEALLALPLEVLETAKIDPAIVELQHAEFTRLERQLMVFGQDPGRMARRAEIIHFFINICLELERSDK